MVGVFSCYFKEGVGCPEAKQTCLNILYAECSNLEMERPFRNSTDTFYHMEKYPISRSATGHIR